MLTVKMDAHDSKFQKLEEDLREVIDHGGSDFEARPHVQKNSHGVRHLWRRDI